MKKFSFLFILLTAVLLVSACAGERGDDRVPLFLDVQLTVNPEHAEINEPVTFTAKVTYGDKPVTDPDDVEFEIWRANDENHENIPVKHAGDGIYELQKSFTEEGTYYIYSHVTAEGYHAMPKKEFIIGEPSEPEEDGGRSFFYPEYEDNTEEIPEEQES